MRGTLPPQAYTRDVLSAAYNWLQGQPESMRQLAKDTDSLVGLYLRARRNGAASLESEAPRSTEDFRQNLKSLATELKQFSGAEVARDSIVAPASSAPQREEVKIQIPISAPTPASHAAAPTLAPAPNPTPTSSHVSAQVAPTPHPTAWLEGLDPRTKEILTRVRNLLNLSSEQEALRAVVTLGFERIRCLFVPNNSNN